jgi:oxygen-independent coproporphyrinogen-3 oxidase
MRETMMMGLRLVEEGVSRRYFAERFGVEPEDMFGEEIALLAGRGLLEWAGDERERLRLTPGARFIGNQVFRQFV